MKPVCDRFEPDWELVCVGALEPWEMDEAHQHLRSGCVVCSERYRAACETVAAVGSSLPSKTPPRWNEQTLLNRIANETKGRQVSERKLPLVPWAVAAALAATTLLGWWQHWESNRQLNEAQSTIAALRAAGQDSLSVPAADRLGTEDFATPDRQAPESTPANADVIPDAARKDARLKIDAPSAAAADEALLAELSGLREQVDELLRQVAAAKQERNVLLASYEASQVELQRLRQRSEQAPAVSATRRTAEDPERQQVLRELRDSRRQQTLMAAELERTQRVLQILRAGDLKQVELQATDAKAGGGNARLLVSPREGLVLVARQLPKLPPDKTYQLWIIGETNPAVVSGGLLRMDDGGAAVVVSASSETLRRATGFAITDEPRAGSIVAQGTKLMFGAL